MTTFCDFDECDLDGTERRGSMTYCKEHARQSDELDAQASLLCARCSKAAQFTVGDEELCSECADMVATHGPAKELPAFAATVKPLTAVERKRCDFDECEAHATERRGPLQLCSQHGAEHDEMEADVAAEDAKHRDNLEARVLELENAARAYIEQMDWVAGHPGPAADKRRAELFAELRRTVYTARR